jgi:hypothetical protein
VVVRDRDHFKIEIGSRKAPESIEPNDRELVGVVTSTFREGGIEVFIFPCLDCPGGLALVDVEPQAGLGLDGWRFPPRVNSCLT